MRRLLINFGFLLITGSLFSQMHFESGYFINNSNERINCFIKNAEWLNNPEKFEYRIDSSGHTDLKLISGVKEFAFDNGEKFVRAKVEIDTTTDVISKLNENKYPEWKLKVVFLKVIVEGKANLYSYEGNGVKRYFYNVDSMPIKQLIHKRYITNYTSICENNLYLEQLSSELHCETQLITEPIKYELGSLLKFFIEYNQCKGIAPKQYIQRKSLILDFKIVVGVNYSNIKLKLQNDYHFPSEPFFLAGFETEAVLPFNKNRWSIVLEPNYGYYVSVMESVTALNTHTVRVNYHFIEVQAGFRFSYFLNDKMKIFLNPSYVIDIPIHSNIMVYYASGTSTYKTENISCFAFAIGYRYQKCSIEFKYFLQRDVLNKYIFLSSELNNISLSIKYSFLNTKIK